MRSGCKKGWSPLVVLQDSQTQTIWTRSSTKASILIVFAAVMPTISRYSWGTVVPRSSGLRLKWCQIWSNLSGPWYCRVLSIGHASCSSTTFRHHWPLLRPLQSPRSCDKWRTRWAPQPFPRSKGWWRLQTPLLRSNLRYRGWVLGRDWEGRKTHSLTYKRRARPSEAVHSRSAKRESKHWFCNWERQHYRRNIWTASTYNWCQ